jgi:hypothetical protein
MEILDDVIFLNMFKRLSHMQHTNIFFVYFFTFKIKRNAQTKKKILIQTKTRDIVFLLTQTSRSRWIDPEAVDLTKLTRLG